MPARTPDELDFPANWDRLSEREDEPSPSPPDGPRSTAPPLISLVAAAWGDLVAVLAVCTATLLALLVLGHPASLICLPWSCGLAVLWWCAAAAVLVTVRRATPGMLMAGVFFADSPAPGRLAGILAVAVLLMLTLGLPALVGARRSPLGRAAGSALVCTPE